MLLFGLTVVSIVASFASVVYALRFRNATPQWRSLGGVVAVALGTASAMLYVGTGLYARTIGGFPFYDPTLLRIYRYGALTALLGLVLAIVSRSRVRAVAFGFSGFMFLLWVLAAEGE